MQKIPKLSILLSFIGLWLIPFLKNEVQIFIGFVLIFSFGIIHGANDLLLIRRINNSSSSYSGVLLNYISVILLASLLFSFVPWFAMLLFILVSCYHFGEQHWDNRLNYDNQLIKIVFETIYGCCILTLLFFFHQKEVIEIIFSITSIQISEYVIPLVLKLSALTFIFVSLYNYAKSELFRKEIFIEILYFTILSIIFKIGSLIWGFTIYFIFWHSLPSLVDQIKFLYKEVTLKTILKYSKSASLYWLISIIGIFTLYTLLKDYKIFDAIFFSFLAAITFPHVIVIERMYSKNKKTE
jgi:Brp/Blh family beta-carotene 15,15'-monooxygenase